jgi:hypothetical protein
MGMLEYSKGRGKFQIPTSRKTPNFKHQASEKLQTSSLKLKFQGPVLKYVYTRYANKTGVQAPDTL